MKIIKPYYEILTPIDGKEILRTIELAGRVCYKSEDLITDESAEKFIANLLKRGHETPIEHVSLTVKFVCDRGVMAELTRHRLASFNVESTRYCNYSKDKFGNELTFVKPVWFEYIAEGSYDKSYYSQLECDGTYVKNLPQAESEFLFHLLDVEDMYFTMLRTHSLLPEQARSILPNSLKTEIIMTANLREWRHFFKLRTERAAHIQMRELTVPLLEELKSKIPVLFDDIQY